MISLDDLSVLQQRPLIGGAPEGFDALALGRIAALAGRPVLHICRDDRRLDRLAEALAFFRPDIEALTLPAWDCLPYDRVSPNGEIVSRRVDALAALAAPDETAEKAKGLRIVLTTVSAALQRVPPPESFQGAAFACRVGARLDADALVAFLVRHGYNRSGTVREPGEFALRGGIVDLFPPGSEEPLRLDLFGDELESVRTFDPMSQRTTAKRGGFTLRPASEITLDEDSVSRFRGRYRELFGNVGREDPLYEAISAGRRHAGMEHWLPLFHERLATVFDYVPDGPVTADHQAAEAVEARLDAVAEYYAARLAMMQQRAEAAGAPTYKPVPPDLLFLDRAEWDAALSARPGGTLSPFAPAPQAGRSIDLGARSGRDFADARNTPGVNVFDAVAAHVGDLQRDGRRALIAAYTAGSRDRLAGLLREHGLAGLRPVESWPAAAATPPGEVALVVLGQDSGFVTAELALITEQDILGDRLARPARRRRSPDEVISELSVLSEGDLVVHAEHGVGRYESLVTLEVSGAPHDCLKILYAGDDKLFVPVENLDVLSRFGSEDASAQLDRLGGAAWQMRKARVKARIKEMAERLLKVAAERQLRPGRVLTPADGLYDEFCARFPYPETEDQARSIEDVLDDLAAGRPMDRLVCGDVGFGKTEVALRAAFIAVMAGLQVAVVVPTTLLARQHFQTFGQRFRGMPVRIRRLSRLVSTRERQQVREEIAAGTVDIVIGTQALLAPQIRFRDLGLLIVDEEQHFGVAQKERLKELRSDVHVLTLTATPIPRTLQMALAGVREMSIIATPPVDRLAVRTFVLPYDPVIVREALMRERFRGGQSFYVCPRIEDLPRVHERLRKLVPEFKTAVAHGRMAAAELEAVMGDFYDGKHDLLLCTNIIESGLDIPTVNTLIVHRAEMFGLAQLYQLRGRIGRAKTRAYAYLTLPPDRALTKTAEKRLRVMQTLDTLGAGFTLASHDLDIRGAGNLLGEEQSGQIREVGIELYQHMLEEAVAAARGAGPGREEADTDWTPHIGIGMPVLIPEDYVADLPVRLGLYRRIAALVDRAEIDAFAAELADRFGPLPEEVENLLRIVAIKRLCRDAGVDKLEAGPKGATLSFRNNQFANPAGLVRFIAGEGESVKLRPDHTLVYRRQWDQPAARIRGVEILLGQVAALAQEGDAGRSAMTRLAANRS